jgi:hypothetical protein
MRQKKGLIESNFETKTGALAMLTANANTLDEAAKMMRKIDEKFITGKIVRFVRLEDLK